MHEKRLDVQGLRAVAILLVVAYHGRFGVSGGFAGVDVFFVISGFVITGTLTRELEGTGRLSFSGFYARRVKRLLPGLATMLTFVALAGMLLAPLAAVHMSAATGAAASVFGANWYLASLPHGYFDPSAALDPLLHTWTLAVEEQFYLVYPALLLLAWRRGGRRAAGAAVAATCLGSLLVAHLWSGTELGFYGSPARAWEFGSGCLVALGAPFWRRLPQLACSALAALGAVALAVAAVGPGGESEPPLSLLAIPVLGTCLLIVAGSRCNVISSLLGTRPAVALGDLSYSWYLWHWPLIVFAAAAFPGSDASARRIAAIGSLLPATASYLFVENRVRFSPTVRGRRLIAVAAVCVEVPVAASLVQLHVPLAAAAAAGSQAMHADVTHHCDRPDALGSPARAACVWNAGARRGEIVLIGDSNAGQFTEPVAAAAARLGYRVRVATFSDCPFIPLRLAQTAHSFSKCLRFDRLSLAWLLQHPPRLAIVAMRADAWIEDADHQIAPLGHGRFSSGPAAKAALWQRALREELRKLGRAGVPVLLVHPIPLASIAGVDCPALRLLTHACGGSTSRASVDRELARTLAAERSAVSGIRNASLLDLESSICGHAVCSTVRGGVALFRDEEHLTVAGSEQLTPVFERAIRVRAGLGATVDAELGAGE